MSYLLTSLIFTNGLPCINGNGAGVAASPMRVETSVSDGYVDVTSIENWAKESYNLSHDYIFIRDRILELVNKKVLASTIATVSTDLGLTPSAGDRYLVDSNATESFLGKEGYIAIYNDSDWLFKTPETLGYLDANETEKDCLLRFYIGVDQQLLDYYLANPSSKIDQAKLIAARNSYHEKATNARYNRIKLAESLLADQLPDYLGLIMLSLTSLVVELNITGTNQLYSIDLHKNYKDFGVKGQVEDYNITSNKNPGFGIMDWVYGRSIFTGKGLINLPFQPATMSMSELCERLHQILVLGI